MDKTSFFWTSLCATCHPGGGAGEFDRDGHLYYDVATQQFGYELENKTPQQVTLNGDYALVSSSDGSLSVARWDISGVSEPDCLFCHRGDRTVNNGTAMNWVWRTATLRAGAKLVDQQSAAVPAFAAAATAGQGWFSAMTLAQVPPGKPPLATLLQIDYQTGIQNGSLTTDENGELLLRGSAIASEPRDYACWGCHVTPELKKRGRLWFNPDVDVHYAAFNNLSDPDSRNDVPPEQSTACVRCHPSDADHNIGKGNALLGSVQDETDYEKIRTCRDCHLKDSPTRDPKAPVPASLLHQSAPHMDRISCQFCHIPYRTTGADLVVDNATTGNTITYGTDAFLSADPLDPANADRSRWHPAFRLKKGEDGKERLVPVKNLLSVWWGDWDKTKNVIAPIILWRVRGVTGGQPLQGVTDDNRDSIPEVNRLEEIALYLTELAKLDRYGSPVAVNPVLVKGGHVFYADTQAPGGVSSFEYEHTGIKVESAHPFGIDHNVLKAREALGATGCGECHKTINGGNPTRVFDRLILVDPFDQTSQPVYEKGRDFSGVDPK